MSAEQSRLRRTLLGSLLDAAAGNRAHGADAVRLFEMGAVFLPVDGERLPNEPWHVAAVVSGPARPPSWRDADPRPADYFAIKGVLEGLLGGLSVGFALERTHDAFLHPGRSAAIAVGGRGIGWIGEVHPLVAREWDLDGVIAAFELDLDALPEPSIARYEAVKPFPAVREDLAVVVPESVSAARVRDCVLAAGAPLIERAEVFDVYRDPERVGEGNVSLALRLVFAAGDRTLRDEEVARQRRAIAEALASELDGRVRDS